MEQKEWYQEKYRRTLMDMHIEDWDEKFLAEFSPEKYVESLKAANIDAPMIYIQSHVGLCYWPTKTGEMHKSFVGKEDQMKRLFDLCHENGMSVVAYYSLVYNNWTYEQFPGWRMKTVDGLDARETGKRFGFSCPNNRDYVAFTKQQMAEFFDYFQFEGIFMDMVFWPYICYCDSCKKRWAEEVGGEMPTVIDWNDPRWLLFQKKREEWITLYSAEITAEVKKLNPKCSVEHQYQTAIKMWRFGGTENIAQNSDYAGGDLYGGFVQQSFACKLYHTLSKHQPFEYMTCRCYPHLREHTTSKSQDQLELGVMLTHMHHGAALIIDAIDPCGTHDHRVYEQIGRVFEKSKGLGEHIKRGKHLYDVGIYFNLKGKMDPSKNQIPVGEPGEVISTYPHLEASLGAANALRSHHIPFTVLNNWKLELINKDLQALVVSDAPNISEEEINGILQYVKAGGRLYLSGISMKSLVKSVFGITITGWTKEQVTYIAPAPGHEDLLQGYFTEKYPLTMLEAAVSTEGTPDGEVLATLTLPYTVPNPYGIWDDVGHRMPSPQFGPEDDRYRFVSIHSNPPGIPTNRPAILRKRYGEGEIIWSALPFEKADRMQHQDIFAELISGMLKRDPVIKSNAPENVELVTFACPEAKEMTVGAANLQENFRMIPVHDFDIAVKTDSCPKNISLLPSKEPCPFTYEEGYARFHVDCLKVAEIFLVEL